MRAPQPAIACLGPGRCPAGFGARAGPATAGGHTPPVWSPQAPERGAYLSWWQSAMDFGHRPRLQGQDEPLGLKAIVTSALASVVAVTPCIASRSKKSN